MFTERLLDISFHVSINLEKIAIKKTFFHVFSNKMFYKSVCEWTKLSVKSFRVYREIKCESSAAEVEWRYPAHRLKKINHLKDMDC